MGSAAGKQGGPMRPQQPQQQRPMGQQGKGHYVLFNQVHSKG